MRAASLAAELKEAGHDASIEEGAKGQYDLLADGELIFSKQAEGTFPELAEIVGRLGGGTPASGQ